MIFEVKIQNFDIHINTTMKSSIKVYKQGLTNENVGLLTNQTSDL